MDAGHAGDLRRIEIVPTGAEVAKMSGARPKPPPPAEALPPHSPEAERGLLSCLLAGAPLGEIKRAGVTAAWFYELRHQKTFAAIEAVSRDGATPDMATVGARISADPEFADGLLFLAGIEAEIGSAANWPYWTDMLREKLLLRKAHQAEGILHEIVNASDLTPEKLIAEVDSALSVIRHVATKNTFPPLQSLAELPSKQRDDADELLRFRFLCRGGGLLLAGPTGIGKSAFGLQAAILWAIKRPAFDIHPARALRSLFVQAENDPADMGEMRDGVIAGLELCEADAATACQQIMVAREDSRTGHRFFAEVIEPLLSEQPFDLLWIDPALSFLGGESNSQRDVGGFLRNGLNPLLHRFNCAAIVIHHTNKPPSGREKPDWNGSDFAYLGSGSAEWANWARAVLAIRATGQQGVFELRAGKRGSRLGWKDADGGPSYLKFIGHARESGVICWREVDADEVPQGGRPKDYQAKDMLELLPPEGLASMEWQKTAKVECGISERSFFRERKALETSKRILKSKVSGKWQPIRKP